MKIGGFNLSECGAHGHFTGRECPFCPPGCPPGYVLGVAPTEQPAAIEYDRTNWYRGPEKELHGLFESELIRRGISYIHARTDQKSTIANGWPDFSMFYTAEDGICRACFVELKNKTGRTSKDQDAVIAELNRLNIPVIVTGDFREAVEFVKMNVMNDPAVAPPTLDSDLPKDVPGG